MKRKLYTVAIACACLLGFSSCESWLEEDSRNQKTDLDFPTNQSDIESMVNYLYRTGAPSQLMSANSAYTGPVSTYQGMLTGYFINEYEGQERTCAYARQLTRQNYTNTVGEAMSGLYEGCYKAIRVANSVIKYTSNIASIDASSSSKLIGQAKFFRAFNYFTLVKFFGGVPLTTEPYEDASVELQLAKSSTADIYKVIEQDLTEAVAALPATKFYDNGMQVGKYAAAMLLTSVYMQEGKYAEAATAVKTVLNSGHSLTANDDLDEGSAFNKLRTTDGLNEVIYSYEYDATVSTSGWWPTYAFDGTIEGKLATYSLSRRIYGPTKRFLNVYEDNDLRIKEGQFFRHSWSFVNKNDNETKTWSSEDAGCWYWADETALLETGQGTKDKDFFRYSEALLDAAEAIAQTSGVTDEAAGYLAQVQARSNTEGKTADAIKTTLLGLSKDAFIHACWTERLREFPLEFKIWDDCLRTQMFPNISETTKGSVTYETLVGATNASGATFKATDLVWPFSIDELQRNSLLEQNEGYASK